MSVEISEGRVTNYVLSTLSAVLVVVIVVQYEWERGVSARSPFVLLFDLLFIFFLLLHHDVYVVFDFVFLVGATIKWKWKTTTKRNVTIRFGFTDNMIFLYSREISLCIHKLWGRRRFTIGVKRRFSTEHATHIEQFTKPIWSNWGSESWVKRAGERVACA